MWPVDFIEEKRDGKEHSASRINRFIKEYTQGNVTDYQAAAWLMAVYLKGMSDEETAALTTAMRDSGEVVDLSPIKGITVDKHSTGGIADTTTLITAPLVAAAGVKVAKMSGRGLGFTGGTLDKLESVPGFRISLTKGEFFNQVNRIGIAVIGQSAELAPADKLLYALRDTTGTVESIPLIASSVMSKKLAGGAQAIVLDVKYGDGAFMKTRKKAEELARAMVRIGKLAGKPTTAVLTSMDAPLGMSIGNSLEIDEAVQVLSGTGGKRLTAVVLTIGAYMLKAAGKAANVEEGKAILQAHVDDGSGLKKFKDFLEAQGGDASFIGVRPLTEPVNTREIRAEKSGVVTAVDGRGLGAVAMELGAGRAHKEDPIELYTGLALHKEIYDTVAEGDPLCTVYATARTDIRPYEERIRKAFHIEAGKNVEEEPVIGEVIEE